MCGVRVGQKRQKGRRLKTLLEERPRASLFFRQKENDDFNTPLPPEKTSFRGKIVSTPHGNPGPYPDSVNIVQSTELIILKEIHPLIRFSVERDRAPKVLSTNTYKGHYSVKTNCCDLFYRRNPHNYHIAPCKPVSCIFYESSPQRQQQETSSLCGGLHMKREGKYNCLSSDLSVLFRSTQVTTPKTHTIVFIFGVILVLSWHDGTVD